MKLFSFTVSLLAFMVPLAKAQTQEEVDARSVGLLPLQRQGVIVQLTEQNPYGFPKQKKKESSVTKAQYSEEDQIREVLSSLKVRGVIGGGRVVLLGDLILKEGEFVDDVLPGQTERLLVKEITDAVITIEWVEEYKRSVTRDLKIPIDMSTRVEALLKGQVNSQQKRMGTIRNLRGQEEEMVVEEDQDAR